MSKSIEHDSRAVVFTKYCQLLGSVGKMFKTIDVLCERAQDNEYERELVKFLKHQKDDIERFVLEERCYYDF